MLAEASEGIAKIRKAKNVKSVRRARFSLEEPPPPGFFHVDMTCDISGHFNTSLFEFVDHNSSLR